jgi:hypothetical protein
MRGQLQHENSNTSACSGRGYISITVHHTLRHLKLKCANDMTSTKYSYEPLANESSFCLFSIVKLRFPAKSDLIEIRLFEADFEDPPAFEAVSYAWGQDHSTSVVLYNGQKLPVTTNVEVILRRLGPTDSVGTSWIDSICINQASVADKNIQVPRMRTIYSEARLVWIWLGEGSDVIETALVFLSEVSAILEEQTSFNSHYNPEQPQIRELHARFESRGGQSNELR